MLAQGGNPGAEGRAGVSALKEHVNEALFQSAVICVPRISRVSPWANMRRTVGAF